MAVAFGSATSVAEATAVNATYTAPSGITNGDLLLIWHFEFAVGTPPVASPPAGFAQAPGTWPLTVAPTGANGHNWLWYKIAASESGNYVVTHTSCVRRGIMARVSGNDTTDPFEPNPSQNVATNNGTYTYLGLTTTVDSELIMVFGSDWNDTANNLTAPTGTTPTFTERVDIAGEYLATGSLSPAGATGNKTMTNNSAVAASSGWLASMVAVQPPTFVADNTMKGGSAGMYGDIRVEEWF